MFRNWESENKSFHNSCANGLTFLFPEGLHTLSCKLLVALYVFQCVFCSNYSTWPDKYCTHSCCVCFGLARTDITVTLKVFVEFSVISEVYLSSS
jgi:hypothetical protein